MTVNHDAVGSSPTGGARSGCSVFEHPDNSKLGL